MHGQIVVQGVRTGRDLVAQHGFSYAKYIRLIIFGPRCIVCCHQELYLSLIQKSTGFGMQLFRLCGMCLSDDRMVRVPGRVTYMPPIEQV